MGPKRKKSKPNPVDESDGGRQGSEAGQRVQNDGSETPSNPTPGQGSAQAESTTAKPSSTPARTSWYGSWRSSSKSTPVAAQLAKESISVAQGATSESSESARPPSSVSKSVRGSRKSIPLAAEATRVHATSDASDKSRPRFPSEDKLMGVDEPKVVVEEAQLPPEPPADVKVEDAKAQGGSWFGWWSRPDGYGSEGEQRSKKAKVEVEAASTTPLPGTPVEEPPNAEVDNAGDVEGVGAANATQPDGTKQPEMTAGQQPSKASWFGLWTTTQNQGAATEDQATKDAAQDEITVSAEPQSVEETIQESSKPDSKTQAQGPPKPSGWAFWSSDKAKDPVPTPGGTQKQIGELAVADTPSQTNPEMAQFNEQREAPPPASKKEAPKRAGSLLKPQRGRAEKATKEPSCRDSSSGTSVQPFDSSSAPTSELPSPSQTPPPPLQASSILSRLPDQPKLPQPQTRSNLILPSFDATYPPLPNPGYVERLTTYLAQTLHLPGSFPPPSPQHVFKSASPPKIKKAVALGVHGFFPGALIQKFIGQPRGTSVRLANYAATAVKNWCAEHQCDAKEPEIEKVALEGEGYIADRVNTLWKLLLNWLSHLRQADCIIVACHSQGVPVAIMLVAKLIQLGCLAPNTRIGVCAMAGINLGPFPEYRSRLFGGTALELFEFCDNTSTVSRAYAAALEICLRHGVRVTFVGSIDDQLVSLESALYAPLHHPYVNRAVFIDGRLHAPNFLTHLVVFTLKLRNLGVSDHGLVRELSASLAGSLVGGEGHSRVYDEREVYRVAVEFALGSTDALPPSSSVPPRKSPSATRRESESALPTSPALANHLRQSSTSNFGPSPQQVGIAPVTTAYEPPPSSANANPFYLPWAVRGMLEEEMVKKEMHGEVEVLVREFEEWRPTSKVLRDVRFRLEGVRGML